MKKHRITITSSFTSHAPTSYVIETKTALLAASHLAACRQLFTTLDIATRGTGYKFEVLFTDSTLTYEMKEIEL